MKSILVTGGAGYIGSHTCKALHNAGYTPVTFDSLVYGHREAVKWGPFIEGDLSDKVLLKKTLADHDIEAVIHFAAYAYVGESMEQPQKYFTNNVVNTLSLLDVMHDAGVGHIVFSSTCATYGLPERVPIDESHPQQPVNPYGESKLFIERALKWYDVAYAMKSVALRYFNAAGADADREIGEDHEPETHLIPLVIQAALRQREQVSIFGTDYPTTDGTAIRDYIHVTDLGDAHVRALEYLLGRGESVALNLGTGRGYSVRDVITSVENMSGRVVPVINAPRRAGDPAELVADAAAARHILGWEPRHSSLDNITKTALEWHLSPGFAPAEEPATRSTARG
jgi:UDP-glucose-4-epimerase GalE